MLHHWNRIARYAVTILTGLLVILLSVPTAFAAGAITPSGGGSYTNGSTFTITVKAGGATFDSLQGTISVSGPVSIVSFSAGSATWLPGKSPANNTQFVGIAGSTSSLTVATIKLKGTKEGSGKVTVSGVRLAKSGSEVGTGGGTASFTITRAPTPPGGVAVSSSTHPNQDETYEATTAEISWTPPANGADGYSYVFDQVADTVPGTQANSTATTASFPDLKVGTYYFHIRAHNGDGWGETSHYKINIKNTLDASLGAPVISSISLAEDYVNDIETGTVTGVIVKGTGLAGYTLRPTFTPEIALPAETYPPLVIGEDGSWNLRIIEPVKAGFYKLTALAEKEGVITPSSTPTTFEVSAAEGGKIRLITAEDTTAIYKEKQQALVAAAESRRKTTYAMFGGGLLLILVGIGFYVAKRRLLSKAFR